MAEKVSIRDIYDVVNRLESKMDTRLASMEARINKTESKLDNLIGKAALGVVIFMAFVGGVVAWFFEQFKK
jgi:hypothetical protein